MKKEIAIIGLGKMGYNMVLRLLEKGYRVVVFDVDERARKKIKKAGAEVANSLKELVEKLKKPRVIWIMVPHWAVGGVLKELRELLSKNDTVIDGGNSFYQDSLKRAKELESAGINFLDVGVSGGPGGARRGACLMIGGKERDYKKLKPLFRDLAAPQGYSYMGEHGAGHFVKMVHNGVEYGMMQAIAEGFTILKNSKYKLNLRKIANLYNHGSVIESRLVGWLEKAFEKRGQELKEVSGVVGHTGEGEWTIKTAKEMKIPVKIIEESFKFRVRSKKAPSYTGQILSALREQFGGHKVTKK